MTGRAVAIGLTILMGMWGTVQSIEASAPGALGLDQRAMLWLGVLLSGVGVALGFLPKVQGGGE